MFWNKTKMINDDATELGSPSPVLDNENCYYKVGADSAGNVHLFVGVEYSVSLKMNAEATRQLIKLLTAALPNTD